MGVAHYILVPTFSFLMFFSPQQHFCELLRLFNVWRLIVNQMVIWRAPYKYCLVIVLYSFNGDWICSLFLTLKGGRQTRAEIIFNKSIELRDTNSFVKRTGGMLWKMILINYRLDLEVPQMRFVRRFFHIQKLKSRKNGIFFFFGFKLN